MAGMNTDLLTQLRQALLFERLQTIPELSRTLSTSFPTVKKHLDILIENGEVAEEDSDVSSGGRPAKRYRSRADHTHGLALYLELDAIGYRIFDAVGTLLTNGTESVPRQATARSSSRPPDSPVACARSTHHFFKYRGGGVGRKRASLFRTGLSVFATGRSETDA